MTVDDQKDDKPIPPTERENDGVSSPDPAEGADDESPPQKGSPRG